MDVAVFERGLVNVDHTINELQPLERGTRGGIVRATTEFRERTSQQGVVDECALARARYASDAGQQPNRQLDGDVPEIIATRLDDPQYLSRLRGRSQSRHFDAQRAAQILSGQRIGAVADVVGGARRHERAAVHAGTGPKVDEVVGGEDRFLVVLDHDHGVAEIAQPAQGVEQSSVIALMQADRGLIEDIHHAGETRTDLTRQTDALRLAARERVGTTFERQVLEPYVHEEAQSIENLTHDLACHFAAPTG